MAIRRMSFMFEKRQKLMPQEICGELKAELEVLSKMLTALVKGTDWRDE